MTPLNGQIIQARACSYCGLLHAPTHPCECTKPLVLEGELTPLIIPAVFVWRWLLIGMGCGIIITVAVLWGR